MRVRSLFAAFSLVLFSLPVSLLAQNPPPPGPPGQPQAAPQGVPTRIRGTVEKLDGSELRVKSRDGAELSVTLAPNVMVVAVAKRALADIKVGDFVACTAVKGQDGKLHAVEVRIFPEAMRGVGEGQYPWDLTPDSVMTNATVGTISQLPEGAVLHVTFKGGESDLIVGPETPVLGYVPGDTGLLVPGAAVFVVALKHPDGSLTAARVTAEKDGVKPPM
ncbi:MAG: hypothetical protein JO305_06210 [Alphaproteobacteria bacterium]|nr:hypothetical protein [Alphaproteobacteria bacterium]